jgi:hypothetical protein
MLKSVLNKSEPDKRLNVAVQNFAMLSNRTPRKKAHHFIRAMRSAGFKRNETKSFNFKCSSDLWTSCKFDHDRNKGLNFF